MSHLGWLASVASLARVAHLHFRTKSFAQNRYFGPRCHSLTQGVHILMAPGSKPCPSDELVAILAQGHDLPFAALGNESYFVQLNQRMVSKITGVTERLFVPTD